MCEMREEREIVCGKRERKRDCDVCEREKKRKCV